MGTAVDPWVVAGIIGTGVWTNLAMVVLKAKFPDWQSKAWAPPLIGLVTAVLGAMAAGQVHTGGDLLMWVGIGLGAGSTASSVRDVKVGK